MPTVKSPSKLNLFLEVTGKRNDGYHFIDSLFVCISLYDTIEFAFTPDNCIEVHTNHPEVPDGHANIVYKAIEAVRTIFAVSSGVRVTIDKKIPVGAGLGGGSSNAASCIRTICSEWQIDINDPRLKTIVPSLGADIPFFLYSNGCARCRGIGENISDIPLNNKVWFVLVNPNIFINTGSIYKKIALTNDTKDSINIIGGIVNSDIDSVSRAFYNRLEGVVIPQYPIIHELKETLIKLGCMASLMSGSGSTVFGLARNKANADAIADALKKICPTWFVTVASSIKNTITGS
ncbi:MAG: 4-(cytidine 5'-diphospho)-2-C-methyl-D-erythritol kinase [bacterium]|nr:4-(cytidine 5'-diphospho)-2-C-methyl-D-erythritol kinase [bacterium]